MTLTPDSRTEHDSFGPIEVPATALWGAQTQRALHHFPAGDRMPLTLIHAHRARQGCGGACQP